MLERSSLLVHPWMEAAALAAAPAEWRLPPGETVRLIAAADAGDTGDAAPGLALGMAREAAPSRGLWAWLGARTWQICETEDAALVFSMRRGWWRGWEVFDAEETLVGTIYPQRLLDEQARTLCSIQRAPGRGRFLSPAGEELGAWIERGPATQLAFAAGPGDNPFVRMLLLAAVLTW
jgi:hypothetical protein